MMIIMVWLGKLEEPRENVYFEELCWKFKDELIVLN